MDSILSIAATVTTNYLLVASVIATVLVGVAWGLDKTGWLRGPANRHLLWLFALIGIAIAPGIWFYGPKLPIAVLPAHSHFDEAVVRQTDGPSADAQAAQRSSELIAAHPSVAILPKNQDGDAVSQVNPEGSSNEYQIVKNTITLVWFVGFLFMITRLLLSWHLLACMVRNAEPLSGHRYFKSRRTGRINIMLTSQASCPMCFGFLRPIILLPKQMYGNCSPEDLQMVLRHELAHIERKDFWGNLFQRFVEAVFFFHPFVWYASFQLTHQREQLCDNYVIADGVSPINYMQLLIRIVEQGIKRRSYGAVALFEGRLLPRIRRLHDPDITKAVKATHRALFAAAFAVMICLAVCTIRLEARSVSDNPVKHLADIQEISPFNAELEPTYSISGKILGEIGQPYSSSLFVVQAWVESDESNGSPERYQLQQQTATFSDGSYQLNGLDGRPIYLMVVENSYDQNDEPWPPCYYPGTVSSERAEKINFDGNTSLQDIDIKLVSDR